MSASRLNPCHPEAGQYDEAGNNNEGQENRLQLCADADGQYLSVAGRAAYDRLLTGHAIMKKLQTRRCPAALAETSPANT